MKATASMQHALKHKQRAFTPCKASTQQHQQVSRPVTQQHKQQQQQQQPMAAQFTAMAAAAMVLLTSAGADARPEGVNRPDLLPKEFTTVIDVAGFLTPSEEARLRSEIDAMEQDTGIRLRLLAQNYPETPGLAIRDYWGVDKNDNTVVLVADPTFGDILNFNVGAGVDLEVPRSFWSRLAGKYGNKFYWQEKGEAESILNAISAIDLCLREPPGRFKCAKVQDVQAEVQPSKGGFGGLFGQ